MPILVDLRSDTLTKPTPGMREAIASADVGDDVFGGDPTVNALEARCAALAGKEAALFVPSGTMANAIACRIHTQPGEEVIVERTSHLYRWEGGGYAVISGVSVALLEAPRGLLDPEQVAAAVRPEDVHQPVSQLLWLENTHNYGGGTCYTQDQLRALAQVASEHNLSVHIDGARIMNACVAQGVSLAEIARYTDTLNFCFSKGLGCPVGSVFIGSQEQVRFARRVRKMLGGGMRQTGVVAAAAMYALDHNIERLADDHANAQYIAEGLDGVGGARVLNAPVETNIVYLDTTHCTLDAPALCRALGNAGVLALPIGAQSVRMVTHLDVSREDVEHATAVARDVLTA